MPESIFTDGTLASRVTERLRDDILSKKIETGNRITIKEISERYGISSMPVREAFRTLEGEKLLEINAYKGATVLQVNELFVTNIYGLLRALETLIYETALPHLDENVLIELREINEQIYEVAANKLDINLLYFDANTKFHAAIMAHATNTEAVRLFYYYHKLIRAIRRSYSPSYERVFAAAQEHDALTEAFAAKDVVAMKKATDAHINSAMKNFMAQYSAEQ